ncbi:hypothetical protein CEP54_005610 [Fusarium duplospermum]|uniref:Methyltransferase domain-containing protein n=1 Tax=Fusarium duplospermum TaxID=1325734 RepID=A0A428QBE6_9HYPO|nr:hypothetical protein CEP54_005610 [Fusarium duplospermum]
MDHDGPMEEIPHSHHHHHHLQYHTHHHHHGPPHDTDMTLGEQNKAHFNNVAPAVFQWPWIVELCNQITRELRANIDWIGIEPPSTRPTKILDYACGNGVASRALAPFVSSVRGIDISSGMVEQYNEMALKGGFSPEKVKAVQGDLVDPKSTPSPELNSPEFFNFDLIIMCMALHHVEEPEKMIGKLSERLREGGVLIIVDWVAISESNCPDAPQAKALSNHTMTRMGFTENEVKEAYDKAGLEDWAWKWASTRSQVPKEIGGEQQLFLSRGRKPAQ